MDLGLSEKVAIVCASSKGLGKSISLGLSREGSFVVICARHEEDLIQTRQVIQNETGGEVMSIVTDVSNPKEVDNLVEIAVQFDGENDEILHDEDARHTLKGWISGDNENNSVLNEQIDKKWRMREPEGFY